MVRDRSQLVVVGAGAIGVMLLAFVLAFGQPPGGAFGNGNVPNGGPPGGNDGPNSEGSNGGPPGHHDDGPSGHENRWPVYQRHAGDWGRRGGDWRRDNFRRWPGMSPQVSSSWFQRPYPYHLDYYKMRWGGSYAPYFGNLYGVPFGTPQVVNGGWGPGAWSWGEGVTPPPQGYEWMDIPPNGGNTASGNVVEKPAVDSNSADAKTGSQSTGSESLPAPVK